MKNHEEIIGGISGLLAQGWYTDIMTQIETEEWDGRKIISPIEQIFFATWDFYNLVNLSFIGTSLYLRPQKKVGKFFLDFEVDFLASFINHPIKIKDSVLRTLPAKLPFWGIELDGHEFHEKTKDQVVKDKQREREIVSSGYKVFRFSGSEVYRNPYDCVNEIYRPAEGIVKKISKEIWG